MSRYYIGLVAGCVASLSYSASSVGSDIFKPQLAGDVGDGVIEMHLKGTLQVGATLKKDAPSNVRVLDDRAYELSSAMVMAGGQEVALDWSESDEVRDELIYWRVLRHGDQRGVQADVTGRMVFRPAKDVGGWRQNTRGIAADTPVPVVIVKSITVRLVGPDGKPRGPQPHLHQPESLP
jgi:hypothetical protein